jgi:hypothetical protein
MTPSLTIDAAAKAGLATGAVSPLGVAFTAGRRSRVATWMADPPVLGADGDAAGRAATSTLGRRDDPRRLASGSAHQIGALALRLGGLARESGQQRPLRIRPWWLQG